MPEKPAVRVFRLPTGTEVKRSLNAAGAQFRQAFQGGRTQIRAVGEDAPVRKTDMGPLPFYLGAALLAFLFAALVPLAFYSGIQEDAQSRIFWEKASIFDAYWNHDGENCDVERLGSLDRETMEACSQRCEELVQQYVPDQRRYSTGDTGMEYFSVTRQEEEPLRLFRMWREFRGDWRNWFDVCFDIDGGQVYYIYVSAQCQDNYEEYANALPAGMDAETLAESLAEEVGYRIEHFSWSGKPEDTALAVLSGEGGVVCVEIGFRYYESSMLDLKICCV